MKYGLNTFIKFFAIGLASALVSFLCQSCEVKAFELGVPTQTYHYFSPDKTESGKAGIQNWFEQEYYVFGGYLGLLPQLSGGRQFISDWPSANLCVGQSLLIEGYVAGLYDFYTEQSYRFTAYNNGTELSCATKLVDGSRLFYSCSGIGGGQLTLSLEALTFNSTKSYNIGVSKTVSITCDNTNADIITNNNNNANNIINNQNNNANNIINNNNANADKIVDSQTEIKDTIKDDNVDDANNEIGGFFNSFENNDHGLSGIISAPLKLINAFSSDSCESINIDILGAKTNLPCGSYFFDRDDVKPFIIAYNIIIGGLISYGAVRGIYKRVENFKNPDDSKVEVLDL